MCNPAISFAIVSKGVAGVVSVHQEHARLVFAPRFAADVHCTDPTLYMQEPRTNQELALADWLTLAQG
jgi:hypothetical protein